MGRILNILTFICIFSSVLYGDWNGVHYVESQKIVKDNSPQIDQSFNSNGFIENYGDVSIQCEEENESNKSHRVDFVIVKFLICDDVYSLKLCYKQLYHLSFILFEADNSPPEQSIV